MNQHSSFPALQEAFFDAGELRLHYVEGPQAGPPLVLLHGAVGSWKTWRALLPELTRRWHVYALDLRGHGQSGWAASQEGYHVKHFVADILAFLKERVESPAALVGHSWGGVVALLCGAPGKDRLRGLALEDPPLLVRRPSSQGRPFLEYFNWVYQTKQTAHTVEAMSAAILAANPGGVPPEVLAPWAERLVAVDPNFLLATLTGPRVVEGVDFEAAIRGTACPILLLQADPAKGCALVEEDIELVLRNAADARLFRFPGAGHAIHEEQPEEFLRVLDF